MKGRIFIDSNLWVYLYSDRDKGNIVRNIIEEYFIDIVLSAQVLGEFFNVLIRKIMRTKKEAREIISDLAMNFEVIEIDKSLVLEAMEISIRYKYSYWDSLIVAAALGTGCSMLYTEDLHDGQIINGRLKIVNPFKEK
jgi:predicted nucleic acid-binding protein